MKTKSNRQTLYMTWFILLGLLFIHSAFATATPVNTVGCAWSENAGWVNFAPKHSRVTVHDTHLAGYAWAENIGWIKMGADIVGPYDNSGPADWGVNKDIDGNLSGYAWSDLAGWVNFNTGYSRVTIDEEGNFHGFAWSANVGWINVRCAQDTYGVRAGIIKPYDFNLDGRVDVLYRHPTAFDIHVWFMNGAEESYDGPIMNKYGDPTNHGADWDVRGSGDFDGDGYPDLLYRNIRGNIGTWLMVGSNETTWQPLMNKKGRFPTNHGPYWDVKGVADFNKDGHVDVLYRNSLTGRIGVWYMDGPKEIDWTRIINPDGKPANHGVVWDIRGVGDFNRDGQFDLLFRHPGSDERPDQAGNIGVWLMDGITETSWEYITNHGVDWDVKGAADYNGDGHTDILYQHATGDIRLGLMNGTEEESWSYISNHAPWEIR